jgi:hypothetical protein
LLGHFWWWKTLRITFVFEFLKFEFGFFTKFHQLKESSIELRCPANFATSPQTGPLQGARFGFVEMDRLTSQDWHNVRGHSLVHLWCCGLEWQWV